MDEVKLAVQGQELKPLMDMDEIINDNLTHVLCHIDLVSKEILKYLDGSALINLSLVNKGIREVVTYSNGYKKKVNLRVNTKNMDFLTTTIMPLPPWTVNLTQLTLVCNSELVFVCPEKFSSLSRSLPSLSTLVVVNDSKSHDYAVTFLNKILSLSSNLKSLSLPYDLMLNPITFNKNTENLQELKLTTSNSKFIFNNNFTKNHKFLASTCINLKSFSCQEWAKVDGRYDDMSEECFYEIFMEIMSIIEKNSQFLEKLEFGISPIVVDANYLSTLARRISLPNLKFLELRAVKCLVNEEPLIMDILNNLPKPEQLTTLKLTIDRFPLKLFDLIPQKFPELQNLSLKASKYHSNVEINENRWSFLQSLTELEELEITRFIIDSKNSDFGLLISDKFPDFLSEKINLRKLSLKGANQVCASTFFNGISKMSKLKELSLTGSTIYLDDFMIICRKFKTLEKLEISHLHPDEFNPQSDTQAQGGKIDYSEIITEFSSLKYLREFSIELWSGDFSKVLGFISFPYLKKLTLCNVNLTKNEIENVIGLNGMLMDLLIVNLQNVDFEPEENFEIDNERKNLKIGFSMNSIVFSSSGHGEAREDSDPDSKKLQEQSIIWPDSD